MSSPVQAETLGMRRPPAYVGRVQTEGAVDPAAVAQRAGQAAPQVSTATQVSPPADPDEPLFQALPREGGADGARVAPPSVVHNAQPVQHDNKSQPAPRVARKVSGRQAKVSLASTEGRSQPVMKAARVRGAKFATRTAERKAEQKAERRAKHAGTQKAKQPGKQAHQQLAAQKTKRKGKSASAARRAPKAKSGVRVAAARQPSRSTARIQKAKATTSRQASAAQRPSAMKQPRRSAVSRKEPQARRLVAPKAG